MTDQTKHRKEIRKMLEVKYTPEEISDMGLDLARKTAELRTAEEHKKSVVSHLKSEIDSLTARTNDISNKINSGSEYRNVKCELEYNYETNKKTIIRTDTMEVVYDGEIPDDERQIPLSEPDKKAVPRVMVDAVISLSKDNTTGTVLNEKAIEEVFSHCDSKVSLDRVDDLISQHETQEGYLVKARDFTDVLNQENIALGQQPPDNEPIDTSPDQTDGDAPQTEETEDKVDPVIVPNPLIAQGSVK